MPHPELDIELEKFRELLGEALNEGGTRPLVQLTDEELAVVDPSSLDEVIAPTPHLDGLSGEEREWAVTTALRSLVAHKLVEIANIPELDALMRSADQSATAEVDMRISLEVDLALVLRRTASRALVLEQQTAAGSVHAVVYIHTADLFLVERVTSGGLHIFTLASSADGTADMLQTLMDPLGIADRDGPSMQLDPSALGSDKVGAPLDGVINNALVVGQLVLLADEPGPLVMSYATESAVWIVNVDAPHAPSGVTARSVSHSTLKAQIVRLLGLPA
ncbi:hypothetical protein Q3V23_21690 [Streptomyces sp. VNUA116]|uniref:hypothetical protein n=1 Tax=Streptomyces sp. VNUA116 TaxID=3062449 RepID=UPI00267678C8|nr:hypothetical protein [Streptomyces sp. VNUA116]WKU46456.1 hypothetical protein Q3V23_21690 [Streptomyces sp. VNUA116]